MSRPPPRKPLFQAPTSKNGTNNDSSKGEPLPGEPGWLQTIAKKMLDRPTDTKEIPEYTPESTLNTEGPKRGEKGWLIEMANSLIKDQNYSQKACFSLSQPSTRSLHVENPGISLSQPDIPTTKLSLTSSIVSRENNSSQETSNCSPTPSSFDILGSLDNASNSSQNQNLSQKSFISLSQSSTGSVQVEKSEMLSQPDPL